MTGNGWVIPDDSVLPRCECPACAELAEAIDADLSARLAVTVAAERVDRVHRLAGSPAAPMKEGKP